MATEQRVEIWWFFHLFVISLGLLHFNPVEEGAVGIPEITSIVREATMCWSVPMYQCNMCWYVPWQLALDRSLFLQSSWVCNVKGDLQCKRWVWRKAESWWRTNKPVFSLPLRCSPLGSSNQLCWGKMPDLIDGCSTASFKWTGLDWMGISGWYRAPYCGE